MSKGTSGAGQLSCVSDFIYRRSIAGNTEHSQWTGIERLFSEARWTELTTDMVRTIRALCSKSSHCAAVAQRRDRMSS